MDRLEDLKRRQTALAEQIGAIQYERDNAENQKLVGRFYKYRNCYSCPETDADYWWLYVKVISADGHSLRIFQFQRDNDGRSNTEHANRFSNMHGYIEIDEAEYQAAWTDFWTKLIADEGRAA